MIKKFSVVFISEKLEHSFESLSSNDFVKKNIIHAISDLKTDPLCGTKIPRKLWPKEYITKYKINNLWKYDLPDGWRLIYSLFPQNKVEILSVIIEWFNHKDYERRFNY
jgi:Txe/YoeB family toxin of Txe-Axe toxin-antitoxin module